MGGLEPPREQVLGLLPLPELGYMAMVPPGGLEPPPRGSRARHAALTPQRDFELERMAGFEPAPQGLEGPQAAVTPHSPFDTHRLSKNPLLRAGGRQGIRTPSVSEVKSLGFALAKARVNPRAPRTGETGLRPVSGPSARTARFTPTRLSSGPFEDKPPRDLAHVTRGLQAKQKGLLGEHPQKAWFHDESGP